VRVQIPPAAPLFHFGAFICTFHPLTLTFPSLTLPQKASVYLWR